MDASTLEKARRSFAKASTLAMQTIDLWQNADPTMGEIAAIIAACEAWGVDAFKDKDAWTRALASAREIGPAGVSPGSAIWAVLKAGAIEIPASAYMAPGSGGKAN